MMTSRTLVRCALFSSATLMTVVAAVPASFYDSRSQMLVKRQGNIGSSSPTTSSTQQTSTGSSTTNNGGLSPQIWIPAVIIVLFILAVFVLMWSRKGLGERFRRAITRNTTTPNRTTTTTNTTRGNTTAGTTTTGNTAPRRPGRRTRRTPSQISTTSLPVYMKEPGDQELVIIRGIEDMEDEHMVDSPRASEDISRAQDPANQSTDAVPMPMPMTPLYSPMPMPGHGLDAPLLGEHRSTNGLLNASNFSMSVSEMGSGIATPLADQSTASLMPRNRRSQSDDLDIGMDMDMSRPSMDTMASSNESGSALLGRNRSQSQHSPTDDNSSEDDHHHGSIRGAMPHRRGSITQTVSATATPTNPGSRTPAPDPRGEAPPYFEVVDNPEAYSNFYQQNQQSQSTSGLPVSPDPTSSPQTMGLPPSSDSAQTNTSTTPGPHHERQRSGFRAFLSSRASKFMPNINSSSGNGASGSRSITQTLDNRVYHRPSTSGDVHVASSSTLSLGAFLPITRQRSANTLASAGSTTNLGHYGTPGGSSSSNLPNALTSPSTLSLSISSPLPHTLTRTEFKYPKGGPTPEQIKLISSRENFGRFGVPYGEEAVKYAINMSSTAVNELDAPPEFDFEGQDGEASGSGNGATGEAVVDGDTSPSSSLNTSISSVQEDAAGAVEDNTTISIPVHSPVASATPILPVSSSNPDEDTPHAAAASPAPVEPPTLPSMSSSATAARSGPQVPGTYPASLSPGANTLSPPIQRSVSVATTNSMASFQTADESLNESTPESTSPGPVVGEPTNGQGHTLESSAATLKA